MLVRTPTRDPQMLTTISDFQKPAWDSVSVQKSRKCKFIVVNPREGSATVKDTERMSLIRVIFDDIHEDHRHL